MLTLATFSPLRLMLETRLALHEYLPIAKTLSETPISTADLSTDLIDR
jgi:hypothetical protein